MVCTRYFLQLSLLNNFTNNSKCNNLLHHCLLNVSSFPFLHDVIKCTNKRKTLMFFLSNSVLLSLKNQTNGVNRIVNFTNRYLFFSVSFGMTHTHMAKNFLSSYKTFALKYFQTSTIIWNRRWSLLHQKMFMTLLFSNKKPVAYVILLTSFYLEWPPVHLAHRKARSWFTIMASTRIQFGLQFKNVLLEELTRNTFSFPLVLWIH